MINSMVITCQTFLKFKKGDVRSASFTLWLCNYQGRGVKVEFIQSNAKKVENGYQRFPSCLWD